MLLFKSFKSDIIQEAVKLAPAQLDKPNSITGEDRLDILKRLIQDNKPLELVKGGTFLVTEIDDALAQIEIFKKLKKAFPLHGNGKTISSSDLSKSSVFGGGGGSGGGTLNTKITESHQCVLCQAMLDHGTQSEEFFLNPDILKAAYKLVDVDATLDEILSVEGVWFHSSYESSILLIKQGYINKSHKFHRNSKDMNLIYALKNVAYKNSDQKAVKDDKWNPGDIWAIDKSISINKTLNPENIMTYNKALLQNFVDRKIVGISLKLVKKTAKSKEYNIKLPPDTDDHKIKSIILQGEVRGTFWSNKGGTIIFDSGKIDFRAGSAGGAIKGEIRLKTARGGGAGYGIMLDAAQQVFRKKIPGNKVVNKIAKNITRKDKKAMNEFFKMYSHFYKNESYEDFAKEIAKKDVYWIGSKLACLFVLYNVDLNTGPKANRWITKIVNYAGSKSEDSSVYVKVYQ
jgi:hypothetical protein